MIWVILIVALVATSTRPKFDVASGDWDGWRGALAICRDAVEVLP